MGRKNKKAVLSISACTAAVLLTAVAAEAAVPGKHETIPGAMRDAVMRETGSFQLFWEKLINPGFVSAVIITVFLLAAAACIRIFAVPRFQYVPSGFQLLMEQAVSVFDELSKEKILARKELRRQAAAAREKEKILAERQRAEAAAKKSSFFAEKERAEAVSKKDDFFAEKERAETVRKKDRSFAEEERAETVRKKDNDFAKEEQPVGGRKPAGIKNKKAVLAMFGCTALALLTGAIAAGASKEGHESIQEVMRDAVLHETNKFQFFGGKEVNPGFISAVVVTAFLLAAAACIRVFVIPRFKYVPGRFQLVMEQIVSVFGGLAKNNSPHRHGFLGIYIFSAGIYIFVGTIFELFGFEGITTTGRAIALPAPLSDINAAIALGCLSYLVIMSGGIAGNGLRGIGMTLKDFSLPLSMSFRMFGALLSGLLVTELVYYNIRLSIVLPVVVGVLFTLLHALVQAYVLSMLTSLFYGEVSHPHEKVKKEKKNKKDKNKSKKQAAA